MALHIGKGKGLDVPGAKRDTLMRIHSTLARVRSVDQYADSDKQVWYVDSSSCFQRDDLAYLNCMSNYYNYVAVINDHKDVPSSMMHASVDFYDFGEIVDWLFGIDEERIAYEAAH